MLHSNLESDSSQTLSAFCFDTALLVLDKGLYIQDAKSAFAFYQKHRACHSHLEKAIGTLLL